MSTEVEDFLWFAGTALDGMCGIVTELGDELANRRPDLPGANSPYAILFHCLGVMEHWAGALVAGREVQRDRAAEFTASGSVQALVACVEEAKRRLRSDAETANLDGPLAGRPPTRYAPPGGEWTARAALTHVFEELAQHHGQMEIERDLLLREAQASSDRTNS